MDAKLGALLIGGASALFAAPSAAQADDNPLLGVWIPAPGQAIPQCPPTDTMFTFTAKRLMISPPDGRTQTTDTTYRIRPGRVAVSGSVVDFIVTVVPDGINIAGCHMVKAH